MKARTRTRSSQRSSLNIAASEVASVDIVRNELASPRGPYEFHRLLSRSDAHLARREVGAWPAFAPTPLYEFPLLAGRIEASRIYYKDEANRLGLGSFKALGGAYAVARLMQRFVARETGEMVELRDLMAGKYRALTEGLTVVTATDGNHGRSVAWGAREFGCRCCIVLHAGVSAGREAAIAAYGAQIARIEGNFDDSVRHALRLSNRSGWHLVADTSSAGQGHEQTCLDVMRGYTVMVAEALDQIMAAGRPLPTHVFIQGGVGGLAAAVCAHFWEVLEEHAPIFVIVEPERADCLRQSARLGRPAKASSDLNTVMAGLACGEVSPVAWQILRKVAEFFMTINDAEAISIMRTLADPKQVGRHIVAGESGGVGLGGLLKVAANAAARELVRLNRTSRILTFGTEGATDPAIYASCITSGW